jgi:hypothetical protein
MMFSGRSLGLLRWFRWNLVSALVMPDDCGGIELGHLDLCCLSACTAVLGVIADINSAHTCHGVEGHVQPA